MGTDYQDAAHRHYQDAELLYENSRWGNADQLYGLAAECGLKAIMVKEGAENQSGDLKQHRVHIDILWDEFSAFVRGRGKAMYTRNLPPTNPFIDWEIHQRYYNRKVFDSTKVENHRHAASIVLKILQGS